MKLSIVIPVFNEEKTIAEILKRVWLTKLPTKMTREIIVINDGSTDQTGSIINKMKFPNLRVMSHFKNRGKGAAVRTGIDLASGEMIIIQDADLEYNPQDYRHLINRIKKNKRQVVYGSRLQNYPLKLWGSEKTPLPTHWLGNKFLTWLTNLLYRSKLTDMETCYKLFPAQIIKSITLRSSRFDIEPEVTAKILKMGVKIAEVPIRVSPRTHQQGKKISWPDGLVALWTLIKYRFVD